MRRLGVNYLEEGMEIARPIYRTDGRVALGQGVTLTKAYIKKLPEQGITSVYIKDERLKDLNIFGIISDNIRVKSLQDCKKINDGIVDLKNRIEDGRINKKILSDSFEKIHDNLSKTAKGMVDDFLRVKNPMLTLIDTRINEDYIYAHMVNVAAMGVLLGKALGYNYTKLVDLAKGCLILDVGIIMGVSKKIREKVGKLSPAEMDEVKKHPEVAYSFLRQMKELTIMSTHITYQHHERYNGKGYPRGIKEKEVVEYAYVAGLVDMYDAVTNNKSYRRRVLPDKAREVLMIARDTFFPAYIVDKFLEKIPAYPDGTSLILSTGDEAVVVKQNTENLSRPWVRIIKEGKKHLKDAYDINLEFENSITIKQVLD